MRKAILIGFVSIWVGGFAVSLLTGAEKTKAPGAAEALGLKPAPSAPLTVEDLKPAPGATVPPAAPAPSAPSTGLGPATSVSERPPAPPLPDVTGFGPPISLAWPEGDPHRPPRNLIDQTQSEADRKSVGCLDCHTKTDAPTMHTSSNVVLGCTDCHGGNPKRGLPINLAHVLPKNPEYWETSANPVNASVLLNHETPEWIKFVNPGDLRVAQEACGLCHGDIAKHVPNSMMNHGAMLWNAAGYNNGAIDIKNAIVGQGYGADGIPLELNNPFKPSKQETKEHGWLGTLIPLPRFNRGMPGNVFRIFEKGQMDQLQLGNPTLDEPPGKPEKRLSPRGLGTLNRVDPTVLGAQKTRLHDPLLGFMGSNDRAGDYRSSGCSACHVVYANDRSPSNSGWWHKFGNQGLSFSQDPTISKRERGHPVFHQFTRSIPSSQCMNCHMHQGNLFVNPFLGYTWWDQETDGDKMYPKKQKTVTDDDLVLAVRSNPEAAAARGNWGDLDFLEKTAELNPELKHTQFADYHGHGWVFRAVFKKDKKGNLLDLEDQPVQPGDFKNAVHLKDIHLAKGMQCVDCHFDTEVHGNGLLYGEPRNATTIMCVDCHGTVEKRPTLITSGAGGTWDGKSHNTQPVDLTTLITPWGPRFEWEDVVDINSKPRKNERGEPMRRLYQNSAMSKDTRWEIPQTLDVIDPLSPRYNAKARYAKTLQRDGVGWGKVPETAAECKAQLAHSNQNMDCQICHSSWATSCFGCHLPLKANQRVPLNKYEGTVDRNFTSYNPQVVRDDVFQLGIDGTVKKNRMAVIRSSSAVVVSSQNNNREWVYSQIQTISGDGYSGQAFNPHFPHTTSGHGTTKGCTDCHVSKANDNNAWMASLLGFGTGTVNFFGRYAWTGGEGALYGVPWTEADEPQAALGSTLQKLAYPANYQKFVDGGRKLKEAYEHHAHEINDMTVRGEYLFTANGPGGFEVFDVAQIDQKGFSERITSAPVSPLGQRTYVRSKFATSVALPSTLMQDAERIQNPDNEEQPIHPFYRYVYVADLYEGLYVVKVTTLGNGNPEDNFFHREKLHDEKGALGAHDHFNPDGKLTGASFAVCAGHRVYVCTKRGLAVVDFEEPTAPRLIGELAPGYLRNPKCISVQFRYAFVTDDDGLKVIDISDPTHPRPVRGAVVKLNHAHKLYVARTYAYVANGPEGIAIIDIQQPDRPRLDMKFDAGGEMDDTHAIQIGSVNASMYGLVADGKNGLRVLQLISPDTVTGSSGFSPRPAPRLIATYKTAEPVHAVSRGLDRDRVVDETGHQTVVFGRRGARPFRVDEMRPFLQHRSGEWYSVEDVSMKGAKLFTKSGRELVDPNPPKPAPVLFLGPDQKLDPTKFDLPVPPPTDTRFPSFGVPPTPVPPAVPESPPADAPPAPKPK
jgi:hypothetical protein